ncbi:MAG: hypothetical protein HQ574_00215, partial [Chloroflexi bacterium]|nr:hypothetical protein [Chloroflexota bacterium]
MKETPAWSVTLSKEELYLVAGLLQTGNLIGFEDPFAGYLSVEITERLSCAEVSLQERGYLIKQSHGESVLDSSIAAIVKELTTSENILIAFSNHLKTSYSCLFHFTPDLLLEQLELPNGDIILTALENLEILHERALIFFALKATPCLQMYPSFTINKKDLLLARRSARKEPG